MRRHASLALLGICALLWAPVGAAAPLTLSEALELATRQSPALQAAQAERRRATLQAEAEALRFPWVVQLRGGPSLSQTPSLNSLDGTSFSYGDGVSFSGELRKPFSTGTSFFFGVDASATRRRAPVLPTTVEPTYLGPGYGLIARLGLAHPFLKGGRDTVLAPLRAARLREQGAEASWLRQASEIGGEVLGAYWELWYAQQALEIDEAALALARQSLAEAQARIDEGLLAEVERHSFELRVATLEETLAASRVERFRRERELARLLGDGALSPQAVSPPTDFAPLPSDPVGRALSASPQLRELEAEVALAQSALTQSQDAARPRLDLDVSLSQQGLGNQELAPIARHFASPNTISAGVNLTYEAPLSRGALRADLHSAELGVDTARLRLQALRQQLGAEVGTQEERLKSADQRIALAERSVRLATRLAEAEAERYEAGAAVSLQILEAESNLRDARLRLARAQADRTLAQVGLLHLTGDLLERLAP